MAKKKRLPEPKKPKFGAVVCVLGSTGSIVTVLASHVGMMPYWVLILLTLPLYTLAFVVVIRSYRKK